MLVIAAEALLCGVPTPYAVRRTPQPTVGMLRCIMSLHGCDYGVGRLRLHAIQSPTAFALGILRLGCYAYYGVA